MAKITLKGSEITTHSQLPELGSIAPQNVLIAADLSEKSLGDFVGKKMVLNIFPSIDTGVCATSVRSFNEKASLLENTVVINVSKDLPFSLNRFCASEGLENVVNLSDFRGDFGKTYGVEITDGPLKGLLSRAVVILNEEGKVIYTEQVPEIGQEPDYTSALAAL